MFTLIVIVIALVFLIWGSVKLYKITIGRWIEKRELIGDYQNLIEYHTKDANNDTLYEFRREQSREKANHYKELLKKLKQ